MSVLIEGCVDSATGAQRAVAAGAHRVELCGPGNGGTTPTNDAIGDCRALVDAPLHVMIRPREGSFVYSDDELAAMLGAISAARARGADGIVLGVLTPSNRVAESELAMLVAAAHPLPVVFHRAFDRTRDAGEAFDVLLDHGVQGVLTSGHAATAIGGIDEIAQLRRRGGDRLVVMAGGGVRASNVRRIVEGTGITQVHARATDPGVIAAIAAALPH